MRVSKYDQLTAISYQTLQDFINTGSTDLIPAEIQEYIDQLDLARSLYSKYKCKSFIISTLCENYKKINLTRYAAELIYYDSINFFNLNNQVKKEAWKNFYAEKLEGAAAIAFAKDDLKVYRELISEAAKMRGVFDPELPDIPDALKEKRTVIISIQPEDVGIERINRHELARMIDEMEISEVAKIKAKNDSGINDITLFDNAENKEKSK